MRAFLTTIILLIVSSFGIAQGSLDSGLVAYFPFNGNANDETGNGYDGTVSGATLTSDRFNQTDKAYNFVYNGFSSDKIQISGTSGLNFSTSGFSLSAWIKFSGTAGSGNNYPIVSKHICGEQSGYILMLYNGKLTFWLAGASGYNILSTTEDYTDETWHQVVAVYDGSNQYIYVDGLLKNSIAFSYTIFNSADWALGGYNGCNGGFNGKVDEVKIYNRPLSDSEILDEYNNTCNDLVLFLPFNGNTDDESGSGNNGTVNGASLTQDRFGINNKAYLFDGINDYISIADNPNLFSDELTISWWYKLTEVPGSASVVIGWVEGGHRYQQFFSGGQLSYLNGYNVAQPGMYFNPIYGLNDLNVWKNVVVTYQKTGGSTSTTSVYVDGELKQTDNHTLAMDYVSGPDFVIGKNHNGNFFKGALDDFRIFNRILTANEVMNLYNDSTTYLADSLVAYFPFNGNANDESFLQNNGTAINAALTTDRYGNTDKAYSFNGTDSRIQVPQNSFYSFDYQDFSISAWININNISTARIVSAGFNENDNIWGLGFGTHPGWGAGNRINYFVFSNNNFRDFSSNEITDYSTGEWTFIAASKTDDQMKFYQNGFEVGSATINYPSNSNSYMSIGCRQQSSGILDEFLNGKIDEIKIFNKSFTEQQIKQMYLATTTAPNLIYPGNDSTLINPPFPGLILDWDSTITANEYRLLISNDTSFNIIVHDTLLNTSSFDFYDWPFVNIDNLYWKVRTINDGGIGPWSETNRFNIVLTDVKDETQLPTEFALLQNYPNPFNPSTNIQYAIANRQFVRLKVYDVLGNEIATLVNEEKSSGTYEIEFSVGASQRLALTSGVYFYQLKAGNFLETKKMVFLK